MAAKIIYYYVSCVLKKSYLFFWFVYYLICIRSLNKQIKTKKTTTLFNSLSLSQCVYVLCCTNKILFDYNDKFFFLR
jgi:hypothetical protein